MKKKPNVRAGGWSALKKICTIMKLCLILSLFAVFSVSAGSMAQNAKLSMEKKSVSLIEVLNELSEPDVLNDQSRYQKLMKEQALNII